jgi:hypothetical protein
MRNKIAKEHPEERQHANAAIEQSIFDASVNISPPAIPLVSDSPVLGSAAISTNVEVPLPLKYRVLKTAPIMYKGSRVILRKDKTIDERSYDIDVLRAQNVELSIER